MSVLLVGRAADIGSDQLQPGEIQRVQHTQGFARYFGANAVTGQNCNLHLRNTPGYSAHSCQPLTQDSARAHNIAVPICKQVPLQPLPHGVELGQTGRRIGQRPAIAKFA